MMKGVFTASDGTEVPYYTKGIGQGGMAVVFVHGLVGSAEDWNGIVDIMPDSFLCVSLDLRGHGHSAATDGFTAGRGAADVRELIEHLALDNVVLAGFSLGAFIVLEYVRVYGCGGIAKVVLADITPKFINEDGWDLGLYQGEYTRSQFDAHMRGGIEDFNRQTAYFIYRNLLRADPGRRFRRTAPAWARVLTFLIFGNSRERMAVVYFYFKSTCERDHRDTLSMIAADTAIFYADPGSLFPPGAAKYMAEKIPNGARLVPFHGSPHTRVLRPASRFVRELLSFIGGDVI